MHQFTICGADSFLSDNLKDTMKKYQVIGIAVLASLVGCKTSTNITKTVTLADGSVTSYVNISEGWNYNPNFTGSTNESLEVTNWEVNRPPVMFFNGMPMPPGGMMMPGGQATIR